LNGDNVETLGLTVGLTVGITDVGNIDGPKVVVGWTKGALEGNTTTTGVLVDCTGALVGSLVRAATEGATVGLEEVTTGWMFGEISLVGNDEGSFVGMTGALVGSNGT